MVWMVFLRAEERRRSRGGRGDESGLVPLAVGTLLTWLLAGPFQGLLSRTLPLHFPQAAEAVEAWRPRGKSREEVLTAPSTWLALGVVAVGAGALGRARAFARIGARLAACAAPSRRATGSSRSIAGS